MIIIEISISLYIKKVYLNQNISLEWLLINKCFYLIRELYRKYIHECIPVFFFNVEYTIIFVKSAVFVTKKDNIQKKFFSNLSLLKKTFHNYNYLTSNNVSNRIDFYLKEIVEKKQTNKQVYSVRDFDKFIQYFLKTLTSK